ncbi:DUF4041 domain-containing protein [Candidatus Poriferisocius sp.]|uniref:DUF4041 domain-containing protein n=1 Tax=Candidatus Poriferisocius sp. TaxID=3101276 RepID=UPI003B02554F
MSERVFNPPPGWPKPPEGWTPPSGWKPDPSWPPPPPGWDLWISSDAESDATSQHPPTATARESPAAAPPSADATDTTDTAAPHDQLPVTPIAPHTNLEEKSANAYADEVRRLRAEVEWLRERASEGVDDIVDLDDERVLQEVGIYNYHHPLENAEQYRSRLGAINQQIKEMVKSGNAIVASDMFTYNNSLAMGRKMTADLSKLMLRAYNAEADNCVRALRAGNVVTAKRRLDRAVQAIAKLGAMMEMRVNPRYHELRFEELELTSDYLVKKQEEKEAAREERERLREERRAEQELAAERDRLDKERAHYLAALETLRANDDEKAATEMEQRLRDVDAAIAENDYRVANIRAGYVYVISNPGSFGKQMVKIGMTRRLEPMDRVRELGDASVPFPFDVHALFFADDAVALEQELHNAFAETRVNRVNLRREFFFATPIEVRQVLADKVGALLEFTENPEATQYLQSRKYWPPELPADSTPR